MTSEQELKETESKEVETKEQSKGILRQIEYMKDLLSKQETDEDREMVKAIRSTLKAVKESYTNKNATGYILYVPADKIKTVMALLTNPNPPKQ